jgi:hypothetical protein
MAQQGVEAFWGANHEAVITIPAKNASSLCFDGDALVPSLRTTRPSKRP